LSRDIVESESGQDPLALNLNYPVRDWMAPLTEEAQALLPLIRTLCRVENRVHKTRSALLKSAKITVPNFMVLIAVIDKPRTVAEIARLYEQSRQGFLWVVTSMVKSGLVELVDDPSDRRAKLVTATEKGAEVYREAINREFAWLNASAAKLSAAKLNQVTKMLELVSEAVLTT